MTKEIILQLWQALNEAVTPYDYALIFNYAKEVKEIERENTSII